MATKGILAYKQLQDASVTRALLAAAVITELDQIGTNTAAIQAINDAKGAANGFAPLGSDGVVPGEFIGSLHSSEAFIVTSMAELTASSLRHPVTNDIPRRGDIARIESGNEATQRTLLLVGADYAVEANWSEWLNPTDGVFALRDVSGNNMDKRGTVTLADVAFTGAAADVSGLATVATSGNAADVALADSGDLFTATSVEAGLAEAMEAANAAAISAQNAQTGSTLIAGTVSGDKGTANKAYTISGLDTSKQIFFFRDGVEILQAGFATKSGSTVTLIASVAAVDTDENLSVVGYPN